MSKKILNYSQEIVGIKKALINHHKSQGVKKFQKDILEDLPSLYFHEALQQAKKEVEGALNLSEINLYGVDLSGVDFSDVRLHGAILKHSILDGASFFNAKLNGANLNGASVVRTNFCNVMVDYATNFNIQIPNDKVDLPYFGRIDKSGEYIKGPQDAFYEDIMTLVGDKMRYRTRNTLNSRSMDFRTIPVAGVEPNAHLLLSSEAQAVNQQANDGNQAPVR